MSKEIPSINAGAGLVSGSGATGSALGNWNERERQEKEQKEKEEEKVKQNALINKAKRQIKKTNNFQEKLLKVKEFRIELDAELDFEQVPFAWRFDKAYFTWLNAEEKRLEKLIELDNSKTTPEQSNNNIRKHKDLNQKTATLFLSYLLDFAKEKSSENHGLKTKKTLTDADKDRIIDFLTPISGKQSKKLHKPFRDEVAKIAEKEEVSENFYKDMQIIRKHFEMLGLSEITNKIDADLGEI